MKIALIGYGKMGKAIEAQALAKGHEIVLRFNRSIGRKLVVEDLQQADVAIEFSRPEMAAEHIRLCFSAQVPVVCGTTGWNEELMQLKNSMDQSKDSFFHASNFSIGVNIFFEINKRLAELMNHQVAYDEVFIHESHHVHKLDAPSGTAITIADQIIEKMDRLDHWQVYRSDENVDAETLKGSGELAIFSTREDEVPGTHIVKYFSQEDEIEIIHKAFNREGFAAGALAAACWLKGKKGCFGMADLLKF